MKRDIRLQRLIASTLGGLHSIKALADPVDTGLRGKARGKRSGLRIDRAAQRVEQTIGQVAARFEPLAIVRLC